MSFNFNWDTLFSANPANPNEFYERAKTLLTAALNKSPKPPIIVDDIVVEDLNLGTRPPELEILEIGDIAEDRFRGIFKLRYDADAFLTLKTKVQVNPLHTYLDAIPDFISPEPLAASAPLTIPIQITLSDFRLNGFVILVFSKAKGITIVFRNDPLESLRVSSTFDSIAFIKDYLQKEIERQVRGLFQEELPVAIHRLSLRLWNPEYAASLEAEAQAAKEATAMNVPRSSTTPTPSGSPEEDITFPPSSSDIAEEDSSKISAKNMARLRSLLDSQKTLNVFTPTISEVIYRAWASAGPSSAAASEAPTPPGLSRASSSMNTTGLALGSAPTHGKKKKKHRVINLRNRNVDTKEKEETVEKQAEEERKELRTPIPSEPTTPAKAPSTPETVPIRKETPPPYIPEQTQASLQPVAEKAGIVEPDFRRSRILEKALLAKLSTVASELARQAEEDALEQLRAWGSQQRREQSPPPAYGA
ncbi:hypothetical protein BJ508DRAFT_329916 [Ascobolus immersus RN42]|uniref:Mitochondrial distribution and morphology protein 34 n=1 Tax=Ascobolus immersus RN42 TaxID=1160509 RepID=A0A3N4HV77_ASCIM|nr:hypothetical protein BJ508DRAFT_329916 [Ascobolus immersus RN42]